MCAQGRTWLATAGGASGVSPEEATLHALFRVTDAKSPAVLCRAAALVLRVAAAPATQRNALRLLFRLSKDAAHDALFRAPSLLRRLLAALGGDGPAGTLAADALVYGAGTLKNVSTLQANQV